MTRDVPLKKPAVKIEPNDLAAVRRMESGVDEEEDGPDCREDLRKRLDEHAMRLARIQDAKRRLDAMEAAIKNHTIGVGHAN